MNFMELKKAMGWKTLGLIVPLLLIVAQPLSAQQSIAFVDSDAILEKTPEYATIQQKVNTLAREWETEIENKRKEVDRLFREYQSRELLYTNEERTQKREEIVRAEEDIERLRIKYFGPEGDLFRQQETLMRPLQEKILAAIEEVAIAEGYDYVFDRKGDFLFMFAREQYDLSDKVLAEMGIDTSATGG